MTKVQDILKSILNRGHPRSVRAKKHILASFGIKGVSIVVGLVFVPLILGYLDAERYGIWLTISSIINWISFFDVGLGNGLRNKLSEAFAKEDHELAKTYISTTYALLGLIFLGLLVVFNVVNPFLNWQAILNTKIINNGELITITTIVFSFFVFRFFFKLIGNILLADQQPAYNNLFGPTGKIISLIIIFILTKTTDGSLVILSLVLSSSPVIVLVFATLYFFRKKYKKYRPSLSYVDFKKGKNIVNLGFKFFYYQIAVLVFFSTANFFIAQVADQKSVASYNIAYKYLFLVNMFYAIMLTPIWSAVTDAYVRKEFHWLKKTIRKLNMLSIIMSVGIILLLAISKYVYAFWIGDKIDIPFNLSLLVSIFCITQIVVAPFSSFISGLGTLRLGIFIITAKLVLFFPSAIFFGNLYGAPGIVLAMIIIQIPSLIIEPIQTYKVLNKKATGIWIK